MVESFLYRATMTREQLEAILGPPGAFVMRLDQRPLLEDWAIACGYPPPQIHVMSNVDLTNLYCNAASRQSDINALANEIIATLMKSGIVGAPIDLDAIRQIVRDELKARPAERIEVVTPKSTVTVNGPMHYATVRVIQIVGLGHPVMLVGPAGCGKTTIGERVSEALQLPFYITNVVNEAHELLGFIDGHGKYHPTPFRLAFETGGIWIADEIDAWDAAALLVANSALANGFVSFPDSNIPVRRHVDFRMIATANTFGNGADRVYVGRNELDAASLDRFATINVDYDADLERMFANGAHEWLERVWSVRKIVQDKKIRHVVSSRAIFMGSAALSIGIPQEDVEEIYLFKGMSASDRSKVE